MQIHIPVPWSGINSVVCCLKYQRMLFQKYPRKTLLFYKEFIDIATHTNTAQVALRQYRILLTIHGEKLHFSMSLPSFPKNVCGYQLLQAFIVFTCKNSPKNFCWCKVIHEKCESFSPQIISNIWYYIIKINDYMCTYIAS